VSEDKNMTFGRLVVAVDEALQDKRDAEHNVEEARRVLSRRQADLDNAQEKFTKARDALFREYPEMLPSVPDARPVITNHPPTPAQPVPVMGPGGPVAFRDLDDDFDPGEG
jgi:hypothetical protein